MSKKLSTTTKDTGAPTGVTSAAEESEMTRIIPALREATKPERIPDAEAFASSHEATARFGWDTEQERAEIAASVGTIPPLFEQPAFLAFMDAFHFVPDTLFARPRLSLERATEHEHRLKSREYVVPEGYTFHVCDLTDKPFLLERGALCPVLMYDNATVEDEHPEDADMWHYNVHPALVNAGPEAVHAALWRHIRHEGMKAAEAILAVEQATQVAGAFDPALAAETWPRRAFQTWQGSTGERSLEPSGFWEPEEKAA